MLNRREALAGIAVLGGSLLAKEVVAAQPEIKVTQPLNLELASSWWVSAAQDRSVPCVQAYTWDFSTKRPFVIAFESKQDVITAFQVQINGCMPVNFHMVKDHTALWTISGDVFGIHQAGDQFFVVINPKSAKFEWLKRDN